MHAEHCPPRISLIDHALFFFFSASRDRIALESLRLIACWTASFGVCSVILKSYAGADADHRRMRVSDVSDGIDVDPRGVDWGYLVREYLLCFLLYRRQPESPLLQLGCSCMLPRKRLLLAN
jgi:hypothetical protein